MMKKLIIFLNHLCRNWVVVSGGSARLVNGILSLLCRQHFPSIVTYASKTEPAYSFDHYAIAPDAEYPNKATRGEGRVLGKSPSHNIAQYVAFIGLFLK